jgi:hypothetical protein
MLRSFGNVDPHRGDPNITSNWRSVRLLGRPSPGRLLGAFALAHHGVRGEGPPRTFATDHRARHSETLIGNVAIHAVVPMNRMQPTASSAFRDPAPFIFVLIPAKNRATANSTTPST